nr:MAG: MC010R [Molluscum contagiosum virus]
MPASCPRARIADGCIFFPSLSQRRFSCCFFLLFFSVMEQKVRGKDGPSLPSKRMTSPEWGVYVHVVFTYCIEILDLCGSTPSARHHACLQKRAVANHMRKRVCLYVFIPGSIVASYSQPIQSTGMLRS